MNPIIKNILKFLLFLGIGVALIYLIIRKITPDDWKNIKLAARNADYFWLVLSLVLGIFSHFLRAMRWRILIESVDKKPGVANTFFAVIIGYMANYALPRLGEVSRCGVLSKYEKISFAELFGTVIVERVIDLLMMFLFFIIMILLNLNSNVYAIVKTKATSFIKGKWDSLTYLNITQNQFVLLILITVLLMGGIWLIYKKKDSLFGFVKKFINNFLGGIKSVAKLKNPLLFWAYSVAIWMLYLLMLYVCFSCFKNSDITKDTSHLNLSDALVVFIFGTVGVIVPTPGGIGAYQWLVIKLLTSSIFVISYSTAFDLAWIVWGSQLVLIVILGLVSLLLLPIINKNDQTGVH